MLIHTLAQCLAVYVDSELELGRTVELPQLRDRVATVYMVDDERWGNNTLIELVDTFGERLVVLGEGRIWQSLEAHNLEALQSDDGIEHWDWFENLGISVLDRAGLPWRLEWNRGIHAVHPNAEWDEPNECWCLPGDENSYTGSVARGLEGLEAVSTGVCPGCETCASNHGFDADEGMDAFEAAWQRGDIVTGSFRFNGCDICDQTLGCDAEPWHHVVDGEIVHEHSACTDCVLYLANGDIPEGRN